jgi:hypothetical protein
MTALPKSDADLDGGFPLYILDDDTLVIIVADVSHSELWESTVAAIVADEHGVPVSAIMNLPYCQRRARVVGNRLYCGEQVSQSLLKRIEIATKKKLQLVYDEHEQRCPLSVAELKAQCRK